MTSLGIVTLRWGLLFSLSLPTCLASRRTPPTRRHRRRPAPQPAAAAAPPAAPPAGAPAARRRHRAAPPADAAAAAPAGRRRETRARYTVRLRELEKNVNELKEQIFRTKARLNLLKETVLGGVIGASRAIIHHKNEMGSSFRLIKAAFALDGVQIFAKSDEAGKLADMKEFEIYNGAIPPGIAHAVASRCCTRATATACSATSRATSSPSSRATPSSRARAKTTNITVVGYEKGNITTQLVRQAGGRLPRQRRWRPAKAGAAGGEEVTTLMAKPSLLAAAVAFAAVGLAGAGRAPTRSTIRCGSSSSSTRAVHVHDARVPGGASAAAGHRRAPA